MYGYVMTIFVIMASYHVHVFYLCFPLGSVPSLACTNSRAILYVFHALPK